MTEPLREADSNDRGKPARKLVSVTMFVPYKGISHAGGEYVRRHYMALTQFFDILVIAPDGSANRAAVKRSGEREQLKIVLVKPPRQLPLIVINVLKFFRGVSLRVDVERCFTQDPDILKMFADASVVEFQWTEPASLARRIRPFAPGAKFIVVAHDIVSQRWQREAEAGSALRRALYTGRAYFTKLGERRRFKSVDTVLVFSEKDAILARRIAPGVSVRALNPPLYEEGMVSATLDRQTERRTVLFTGAFKRPENHEAAVWLLRKVWPTVLNAIPDARLILAGAGPLPELLGLVEEHASATATGYVADLGPYYREADVFVSPLLHGAGVKFKNITAMLWKLPILTTPVGAEGIGGEPHYLGITDNPRDFARCLVEALENAERRRAVASTAYEWAQNRFDDEQFKSALGSVYL